jgi:hypothetical protein
MLRKGLYYLEGYSMEGSGRFTGRLCNIFGRKLCGESWGLWKDTSIDTCGTQRYFFLMKVRPYILNKRCYNRISSKY